MGWRQRAINCTSERGSHLSKQLVHIPVALRHVLHELIELIDEIANVDAAHWKRLRKGQRLREAMSARVGVSCGRRRGASARSDSQRDLLRFPCCEPACADDLIEFGLVIDHHRLIVVFRDDLIELRAILALQEIRVALKELEQQRCEGGDLEAVGLRRRSAGAGVASHTRLLTHLESLLEQQNLILALQEYLRVFACPQAIADELYDTSRHFLPQIVNLLLRPKVACYPQYPLLDDEEADELLQKERKCCREGV